MNDTPTTESYTLSLHDALPICLEDDFSSLKELVGMARTLRSEFQISPEVKMPLAVKLDPSCLSGGFLKSQGALIGLLVGGPTPSYLAQDATKPSGSVALAGNGFEIFCQVAGLVDMEKLLAKFRKDAEHESAFAARLEAKLANPAFVGSAPGEIVQKEREKLSEAKARIAKLSRYLEELA